MFAVTRARWLISALLAVAAIVWDGFAIGSLFIEDRIDASVEAASAGLLKRPSAVVVVDLRSRTQPWPIDRKTVASYASTALKKGAAAVGVEVDMASSTTPSSDAEMQRLASTDPRVVPLTLLQQVEDPLGFVYNDEAIWKGIRCESSPRPFATRLAEASGTLKSVEAGCWRSVLKPNSGRDPQTVALDEFTSKQGVDVAGKVVILGTLSDATEIRVVGGRKPLSLVNASVVDASIAENWRRPRLAISAIAYIGLLIAICALERTFRRGLWVGVPLLLVALLIFRNFYWFPITPAVLILVLMLVTHRRRPITQPATV